MAKKQSTAPDETSIQHLDGCPAERVEQFEATRPFDSAVVEVSRCVDCGAATVETKEQT